MAFGGVFKVGEEAEVARSVVVSPRDKRASFFKQTNKKKQTWGGSETVIVTLQEMCVGEISKSAVPCFSAKLCLLSNIFPVSR